MAEELVLHGFDWRYSDTPYNLQIRGWCLDRESKPHLVRIEDFPVFAYMELPPYLNHRKYDWSQRDALDIFAKLQKVMGDSAPYDFEFRKMKKLYYYRGDLTYPMMLLFFKKLKDMTKCETIVERGLDFTFQDNVYSSLGPKFIQFKVWETKIDILRKFFTVRKCSYAQWFKVKGVKLVEYDANSKEKETLDPEVEDILSKHKKISKLEKEYVINWRTLNPISEDDSNGWVTKPMVAAYDIETYSDNHKAMPNKLTHNHVVWIVSIIAQRTGDPSTRKRYVIVLGECNKIFDPETVVISVKTEMELIDQFQFVIDQIDPDILTGYNIFGYDNPYLNARLERKLKNWKNISRLKNQEVTMINKTWKSSAYGYNRMYFFDMEGRISIDMLVVIKRNEKLEVYTLDAVSNKYLKKGKHDVSAEEMFTVYERVQELKNGKDKLGENEFEKLWDKALQEITKVARYCIQDSELVIDLFDKLVIWISLIEMTNVVGVTLIELFTRGQQLRCLNLVYDAATNLGFVIDGRPEVDEQFEGGFVFDPIVGLHDNILCFDFKSLYPSIIRAFNICFTTLIAPELLELMAKDLYHLFTFEGLQEQLTKEERQKKKKKEAKEKEKVKDKENKDDFFTAKEDKEEMTVEKMIQFLAKKKYGFVKSSVRKGILPLIEDKLVNKRNETRAKQKLTKDPIMKEQLEHRQLALKVTANSLFGFLGVKNGKLSLMEGAICITSKGREMIGIVNQFLIDNYNARIIYNDTDSSMVDIHIGNYKECNAKGEALAKIITSQFPPPIEIEFEKAMRMLAIKKKKYAAALIDMKTNEYKMDEKELMVKGIVPAQRGHCKWHKGCYMKLLMLIMKKIRIEKAFDCIVDHIVALITGQVDVNNLYVVKEVGAAYKNDSFFMKILTDELKNVGKPVAPGDRIKCIIVNGKDEKEKKGKVLLGKKLRTLEWYNENNKNGIIEEIDYIYYVEKALMNSIDQLFYTGYIEYLDKMENVGYNPPSRHKFIPIKKPVKMLTLMLKQGYGEILKKDHGEQIKKWFRQKVVESLSVDITPK